mmetsp:Transcript_20738/g.45003  ORF Transcript_20738/g.45003 Transcript_20738/m.45003 type:complete len:338 (+) Transcript_20738:57-1070(+)
MSRQQRRICISLAVCLAVVLMYIVSNNMNINIAPSPSLIFVMVQIDLSNAIAVLQVPCAAKSMGNMDYTSPLIDVIPRYSFNITVQTLAECQDEERSADIEKMQSFLQYMFPLSDVDHKIISTGSFPSLAVVPSSDSLFTTQVPLTNSAVSTIGSASSIGTTNCNTIRGRLGKWMYNSTYGKNSWYNTVPMGGWIRSTDQKNGPYNHSSWTWESDQSSCRVDLLTFHGFCRATHALNITRIFSVGDSIEMMMLVSLFQTMGMVSHVHDHLRGKEEQQMRYAYTFDCPSVGSFSPVDLVFYRSNHLMPGNWSWSTPASSNFLGDFYFFYSTLVMERMG